MIVSCPSCDARFLADEAQFGPEGRRVRCGRCGHQWRQTPPPPAADGPLDAPPLAPPMPMPPLYEFDEARRRSAATRPEPAARQRSSSLLIGWSVLVLFVVALGAGLWFGRERITAAVPEAERLYALVGLAGEPAGAGLEFRDVTSVRREVDGQRVLLIEGTVVNVSSEPRPIPMLRASVTDAEGTELAHWTFAASDNNLPPGGITTFQTSTDQAPREGNLSLVFVAPE